MMNLPGKLMAALLLAGAGLFSAAATDTATKVFEPRFRTLKVSKEGDFMSPPVATLGSGERLVISFDELGDDYSELQYRLIHCNADWQPSRLIESEYLDGFNEADIEDYAFSQNTFVHYVNYRFTIPSERMQPLLPGNYLVQVYPHDDPEMILLQARVQFTDGSALIGGAASGRTDRGINTEWQQLSLSVSVDPAMVPNPYADLVVSVMQNGRPETERFLTRPMRVNGGNIIYESLPELIFPAGNEYRRFETVRTDYPGLGVDSVKFESTNYHAFPARGTSRANRSYVFDRTQRGRFVVDEYNSTDPDLGADYVSVNFSLDFPELIGADIYVDGEFTGHNFSEANRMKYDHASGLYTLMIPLKQGSYNYQYVARRREGDLRPDPAPIEGNYAETCNEYNVNVYLRLPASRGDLLIGSGTIVSRQ